MSDLPLDAIERQQLCDLFDELGPDAPTLCEGWATRDLAAHLVLRERDMLAAPGIILPGPFARFADRRTAALAEKDFTWLVERVRSGPPIGPFRISFLRQLANLNEFFIHHEDVRRANGRGPRAAGDTAVLDAALWRNLRRGSRLLTRRVRDAGLELEWTGADERVTARQGQPLARLTGSPGELLLYLFGRQAAAKVELSGPPDAITAVERARFGM